MKIAFAGLGVMGAPMARHLVQAGHDVIGFNRTTAKAESWAAAARVATEAATATAALTPKRGRARPLAERSIGTPDPGAISFGLIASALVGDPAATPSP